MLQIASLDTKLNERREEFQALQALLAEKKSNYRELATDMGLNESEVEANIKKALVLPHVLKRRNDTDSARKTVQSIEESMPEMVQQVDELRDANVAREHSLSHMQTKQQELAQQVNKYFHVHCMKTHILKLVGARKISTHLRIVPSRQVAPSPNCEHIHVYIMHNNTQCISLYS